MKKKILVTGLLLSSFLATGIQSFAAEQTITSAETATISVNANVASTFEVTVPVSIDITQREVKAFTINASGNISSLEQLSIDLPETVTMNTEGKDPLFLTVTADKETLTADELATEGGTNVACTIDASKITAGEWTGSMSIDIALENASE